jgi:hypothetical protein
MESTKNLSIDQKKLTESINNFIKSDSINLFIQKPGSFFGLFYTILNFIYKCKEFDRIRYYLSTNREAKTYYDELLNITPIRSFPLIKSVYGLNGEYSIEFKDGTRNRKISFIGFHPPLRGMGFPVLNIYNEFIFDKIKEQESDFANSYFETKSIWFLSHDTINDEWYNNNKTIDKSILIINHLLPTLLKKI